MHIEIRLIKDYRLIINILYQRLSIDTFDFICICLFREEIFENITD